MAHVSKGTVSRVINGEPGVGAETRKRVLKLIESVDFHPNAAARRLAGKRTNTLGFVIPHTERYTMTSTFWPVLLTSLTEQAVFKGINVMISTPRSEEDIDSAFRSILKGRRIDGAIIGAEQFGNKQLAELLLKNLPFVMIGKSPHISSCFVDVDNARGSKMAVDHLAGLGHTSIAMLAGPEWLSYVQDRVKGFRDALTEKGLDPTRVFYCPYKTENAIEAITAILRDNPSITGLYVAAGDLVLGALSACTETGRSVPADISVVGFDDHPFFEHFTPPVTVVSQPIEGMGKAAVDMLFDLMDGRQPEPRGVILEPCMVVRRSTCRPGERTQ